MATTALPEPLFRIGTAANRAGIPVETLRVWERRYNVVGPRQSASGQRLYGVADVARLAAIKKLVNKGHAIGSIASLHLDQLMAMLGSDAAVNKDDIDPIAANDARQINVAAVGETLPARLQRRALELRVVASSSGLSSAAPAFRDCRPDALIIELPTLQQETVVAVRALADQVQAAQVVVAYGFAAKATETSLRRLGYRLLRAPADADQLLALLRAPAAHTPPPPPAPVPRRFDDRTLGDIAFASVTLKCECPRHLADLLIKLGHFETYTAECEHRNTDDAALHRHLQQVVANARAMLETALLQVAEAEGLALPAHSA